MAYPPDHGERHPPPKLFPDEPVDPNYIDPKFLDGEAKEQAIDRQLDKSVGCLMTMGCLSIVALWAVGLVVVVTLALRWLF